jgi:hypothetical protein
MRIPMRLVSLVPAVLATFLVCAVSAAPAFASGDDNKPAANKTEATPRPDSAKKIFTNDDIDQMWPKQKTTATDTRAIAANASTARAQRQSAAISRAAIGASEPMNPAKDPLWYAQQATSLSAEFDAIANAETNLRNFRASGAAPGPNTGLQLNAPCDGYTTDNAIAQLALHRQEIEDQLAALADTAQQNDMPPGILRDASAIVAAAQSPLTPAQDRASLEDRQRQLANELNATQDQLSDMSAQASAAGANLLPPTPGFGGNMTTDLIQRLNNRAGKIQSALNETEDAARQAGASQP